MRKAECGATMWWSVVGVAALAVFGCNRPQASAKAATPTDVQTGAAVAEPAAATPESAPAPSSAAAMATPGRALGPVATVNGRDIPADKFNTEFDRLMGRSARIPPDRLHRIAANILQRLIENELRQQAIEKEQVELSEPEFEAAYKEFTSRFVDAQAHFDESAFQQELARSRLSVDQLRKQIREQGLQRKLVEKLGRVEVSESDLKAFYDANPSAWVEAASRDVRPILIRVPGDAQPDAVHKAEAHAQEAYKALKKGGDFEQIARQFDDTPLQPIHIVRGSGDPELEKAAFSLKVGEVSAPVKTRWGYYVLRLLEKNDQRQRPYSEVHAEIQRTLSGRRMYQEDRRIVQELRKKADVIEKLGF